MRQLICHKNKSSDSIVPGWNIGRHSPVNGDSGEIVEARRGLKVDEKCGILNPTLLFISSS